MPRLSSSELAPSGRRTDRPARVSSMTTAATGRPGGRRASGGDACGEGGKTADTERAPAGARELGHPPRQGGDPGAPNLARPGEGHRQGGGDVTNEPPPPRLQLRP